MAAAIGLRGDYTADDLRRLAKASRDAKQTRRLLALAAIYDGASRTDAARTGGVGLQVVRDGVLRFNSSGPAGLIDRKAPGKAALLTSEHRSALAQAVEGGPVPWRDGVVRWRLVDLAAWLRDEFGDHREPADARARAPADRATAASRRARRHTARTRKPWRRLKKLPDRRRGDPRPPRSRQADRGLVPDAMRRGLADDGGPSTDGAADVDDPSRHRDHRLPRT